MWVKKQQLEADVKQLTSCKLAKEYVKAVYCYPAYLTYIHGTSCKIPGWMKDKLKLRFSSVAQSCPTLCDPVNRSTPALPVRHKLPESTQTHVHWVSDAIQPSNPLSPSSPPALNLSQHLGLFQWVGSSHQVTKVLGFQLQHQSFQWTPRTGLLWMDWLDLLAVQGTLKSLLQHYSSKESILRHSALLIVQLLTTWLLEKS